MTTFECDKTKAKSNHTKHKLRFTQAARAIKEGYTLTQKSSNPAEYGEERNISITGSVDGKAMVAIWTPRRGNVRIISVRHARKKEREHFNAYIKKIQ